MNSVGVEIKAVIQKRLEELGAGIYARSVAGSKKLVDPVFSQIARQIRRAPIMNEPLPPREKKSECCSCDCGCETLVKHRLCESCFKAAYSDGVCKS